MYSSYPWTWFNFFTSNRLPSRASRDTLLQFRNMSKLNTIITSKPHLSASSEVGMESRARQFSSSLSVLRRGQRLTSGAMRLTWLQLRTSSVASRLLTSSGIARILLLARSKTFNCFRFRRAVGNVETLLFDKLTSLKWVGFNQRH